MSLNRTDRFLIILALVLSLLFFAWDLSLERGVAAGLPFMLVVLLSLFVRSRGYLVFSVLFASGMVVLGYYLSPDGGEHWKVLLNRALALGAIWAAAGLVFINKNLERRVEETNRRLSEVLKQTNRELGDTTSKMRDKENYLQAILDNIVDGLISIDEAGTICSFNRAAERIFGYQKSEVMGRNVSCLMPEPFNREHDGYLLNYLTTGKAKIIGIGRETVGLRKDGTPFHLELAVSEFYVGNRRMFSGIVRDISLKRKIEQAYREREAIFKSFFNNAGVAISVTDTEFHFYQFNQAWLDLVGFTDQEVRRMTPFDLVSPWQQEVFKSKLQQLGILQKGLVREQVELTRKDGEKRWVDFFVTPLLDAEDRLTSYICITPDITSGKLAEAEMVKAKVEAEEANEAKSHFLACMSHELRTPLNAIIGFSQLLALKEGQLNSSQQSAVEQIMQAGNHLLDLINGILDLARIESGKVEVNTEPVQLKHLIEELVTLVTPLAEREEVTLETSLNSLGDKTVYFDRNLLKQVILNLMTNGVKYNRKGGTLRVALKPVDESEFEIQVSDTGIGISEEQTRYLFEPFNRLGAESTHIQGTGIGLTIVRHVLDLIGGTIRVTSTPGEGSCFMIRLPYTNEGKSHPDPSPEDGKDQEPTGTEPGRATILYIEDNPANEQLVRGVISQFTPHRLLTAARAEEGLSLALEHRPELILLDIGLEDTDGFQVKRQLEKNTATRNIPVIGLSAHALQEYHDRAVRAGFYAYLTKPLNIREFLATLKEALKSAPRKGEEGVNLSESRKSETTIQP